MEAVNAETTYPFQALINPRRKDKSAAVILAVFTGIFSWIYTWERDKVKFGINLALGLATLGTWMICAHVIAIVMAATRDARWYENYPFEGAPTGKRIEVSRVGWVVIGIGAATLFCFLLASSIYAADMQSRVTPQELNQSFQDAGLCPATGCQP